jgi:hypothetical protein
MKNDPAPAQEVIQLLEPLRQAWQEVAGGTGAQRAARNEAVGPQDPKQGNTPTSISA